METDGHHRTDLYDAVMAVGAKSGTRFRSPDGKYWLRRQRQIEDATHGIH
jgi:hypothetical protein